MMVPPQHIEGYCALLEYLESIERYIEKYGGPLEELMLVFI